MDLNLTAFAWFHTILSLVAIVAGFPVISGLLRRQITPGWTELYLVTSVATSVTGFGFPFDKILPSHIFGVLSLIALAAALAALYGYRLAGVWRSVYAISMLVSIYLLLFVLIAQLFLKVHALRALAPTQGEPPFAIAQAILLIASVAVGYVATKRFRSTVVATA